MTHNALMITERFPPDLGGVAKSSFRTVKQLHQIGICCDVLSWTKTLPPGQLRSEVIPLNLDGNSNGFSGDDNESVSPKTGQEECRVPKLYQFGMFGNTDLTMQHSMNVLQWLHQQNSYRFIWGHYLFPAGFNAVLSAKLLGVPSVVSARGNDIDRLMFPPGDFSRLLWTMENADVITSVSSELAKKIIALNSDLKPKVVRNSVAMCDFQPSQNISNLKTSLGIRPNETVLGFCGELRHKKGLPFLLNAFSGVRKNRPACLLIIGTIRASELSKVKDFLHGDTDSYNRIIVTGELDSPAVISEHLCVCDLVLSPSVWDGLPNAVLEAMACQRLVLASDAGGHPEIIDHDVDGWLIPKSQLNHLGHAILECLDVNETKKETVRVNAREKIRTRFCPENEQQRLKEIINDLISFEEDSDKQAGTPFNL